MQTIMTVSPDATAARHAKDDPPVHGAGKPLRVLVADSQPLFRHGLVNLLRSITAFDVVADTATAQETLAVADARAPDVAVISVNLPHGGELIRELLRSQPALRILALIGSDEADLVVAVLRAGAHGCVQKDTDGAGLAEALRVVGRGGGAFGPQVMARLVPIFTTVHRRPPSLPPLSNREWDVLELVARGWDNRRIARTLHLAEKTVRNRVCDVVAKLRVSSRAAAVALARDAGLGAPHGGEEVVDVG